MISAKAKANIFIVLILAISIIFYGYYISENKGYIKSTNYNQNNTTKESNAQQGTTRFSNVEYKSLGDKNQEFITKGDEAFIFKNNPNTIVIINARSHTILKDKSILYLTSNEAEYYKNTQNIKYFNGVKIRNKNSIITAKTANFYKNKNKIRLEGKIIFTDTKNIIKGDIAELDTITNNLEISMYKKKDQVYGQRKK